MGISKACISFYLEMVQFPIYQSLSSVYLNLNLKMNLEMASKLINYSNTPTYIRACSTRLKEVESCLICNDESISALTSTTYTHHNKHLCKPRNAPYLSHLGCCFQGTFGTYTEWCRSTWLWGMSLHWGRYFAGRGLGSGL
jgi:hypothetical protein